MKNLPIGISLHRQTSSEIESLTYPLVEVFSNNLGLHKWADFVFG
jgi:hypothetical protein